MRKPCAFSWRRIVGRAATVRAWMSWSSSTPLPFASSRDSASDATRADEMLRQSSAGKSALQVIRPREARSSSTWGERSRPGMRKNGARSLPSSPSAALTEAMPSSTSFATLSSGMRSKLKGWFWLWVPMVWPSATQALDAVGKRLRHAADLEEGRLHALRGEDVEHLVRVAWQRSVVEGQHHLVIAQRQRLCILHRADVRVFGRVDHDGARGTDRVGVSRAGLGRCSCRAECDQGRDGQPTQTAGQGHRNSNRDQTDRNSKVRDGQMNGRLIVHRLKAPFRPRWSCRRRNQFICRNPPASRRKRQPVPHDSRCP